MYVAITRAKERLWLTRSKSRYLYGKRQPSMRSRFVEELKKELNIPDAPVYHRYSGDYDGYREGYGGGRGYGGYGGYGGYYGGYYDPYYSGYYDSYANGYYGSGGNQGVTTTRTNTEIPSFTPLIFEFYIEPKAK